MKLGIMSCITAAKHGLSGTDISDLPSNLIDCILQRLPIRDAARTSILSHKWRDYWHTISQLVFDEDFYRDDKNYIVISDCSTFISNIITRILSLHHGPVLKFVLSVAISFECHPDIDQWVLFLSRSGIKQLTLDVDYDSSYRCPSYIFSCHELTHLKLRACIFDTPSNFGGFPNLINLEIYFSEACNLNALIASSSRLEHLFLESIEGVEHLVIHAPQLKSLSLYGELKSLSFRHSMMNLTSVSIDVYDDDMIPNYNPGTVFDIMMLLSLTKIEYLQLGGHAIEYMAAYSVPKRLPQTLDHLHHLCLSNIVLHKFDHMSVALCLMASSPKLQKLEISQTDLTEPDAEMVQVKEFNDFTFGKLTTVMIEVTMGCRPEVDFIKMILASSPLLEKMFIQLRVYIERVTVSKVALELLSVPRAPPKAEIKLTKFPWRFCE